MLDALIVFSFVLTGAAVGFFSIDFLPDSALSQVTNIEGLESVTAGFGALVGVAVGLIVQTSWRSHWTADR